MASSIAESFVDLLKKDNTLFGRAKTTAQNLDPKAFCAWTDHILFYYFTDGSKAGLIHKKKQAWACPWSRRASGSFLEAPQE